MSKTYGITINIDCIHSKIVPALAFERNFILLQNLNNEMILAHKNTLKYLQLKCI